MKTNGWMLLVLIAATMCACNKREITADGPRAIVRFSATAPTPDSKITMDETGKTAWVEGDKIMLYYDGGSCEATADESGETTTFTTADEIPTDKEVYCAVYPSTRLANFDGSNVTVDFTQGDQPGILKYSAICTAKTDICGGNLAFHNSGAMIKFTTSSNKIHEARFYNERSAIYSTIGISQSEIIPYKAGTYFIPIPAESTSSGFSVRLKNYDGEDYPAFHRPDPRTFEKGHIYNIGTIEEKVFGNDAGGSTSFSIMSFNILRADFEAPDNNWEARKESCLAMIEAHQPQLIGLQECTLNQRYDILRAFPQYGAVGVSVQGQKVSTYYNVSSNPILYDASIFTLERWGTFWLSETPSTAGSYTWYYNKPRTATWAQFKVKGHDCHLVYVCLHLQDNNSSIDESYKGSEDTYGPLCREREIDVVTEQLATVNPNGYPMIISGDFNSDGTEGYYNTLRSTFLLSRETAAATDDNRTFNGFRTENPDPQKNRVLDNIFYRGLNVSRYYVDRSPYAGRTYISDHYPVFADFSFPATSLSLDGWDEVDY